MDLRSRVIRLAYEQPHLRAHLLPLVKIAAPRYVAPPEYQRAYEGAVAVVGGVIESRAIKRAYRSLQMGKGGPMDGGVFTMRLTYDYANPPELATENGGTPAKRKAFAKKEIAEFVGEAKSKLSRFKDYVVGLGVYSTTPGDGPDDFPAIMTVYVHTMGGPPPPPKEDLQVDLIRDRKLNVKF